MSKLMSSLVAATVVGAFSMSAFAATDAKPAPASAPAAATAAEKPADAPVKKHTAKTEKKKVHTEAAAPAAPEAPAAPAAPAKK
jgi:cytoskeletal protein RodZ